MKVKEIKETVERVVRKEYITEDGAVFYDEAEARKYEESALFAVSKSLKRLNPNPVNQYDLNESYSEECELEIFDIQTSEDLENLKRYLYLKMVENGATEQSVKACFTSENGKRKDYVVDSVTIGHEVMVFWSYEQDWVWTYKDGSIAGYCEWIQERYQNMLTPKEETKSE